MGTSSVLAIEMLRRALKGKNCSIPMVFGEVGSRRMDCADLMGEHGPATGVRKGSEELTWEEYAVLIEEYSLATSVRKGNEELTGEKCPTLGVGLGNTWKTEERVRNCRRTMIVQLYAGGRWNARFLAETIPTAGFSKWSNFSPLIAAQKERNW